MKASAHAAGPTLGATCCAICGPGVRARVLYRSNFELADLNPDVFSARRMPDRIHYRMVICEECGLVRSDPVADARTLAHLYNRSSFNYGDETASLRSTYGRYLARMSGHAKAKGSLLEIGCGDGFFLEEALAQGFIEVHGLEPSEEAIAAADARVRSQITHDVLRPGLLEPGRYDAICMFQVFDHLPDPVQALQECHLSLRPQGLLVCLNHDVSALSARLLGERSPIVDIEHTFLYTPQTLSRLFSKHGFRVLETGTAVNTLSLRHLIRLLPIPASLKGVTLAALRRLRCDGVRLHLRLGNLYLIAQRPP